MLENIGHILYHVLIVIFPILVFYFLAILKNIYSSKSHRGKLLGMVIIILLLTMSFPVSYVNGFEYDFRLIPIIVAFMYIGMIPGIITVIIMLFYLYYLDEINLLILFINYSIITVIFYYLRKKFKLLSLKKKLLSISAVYWLITLTRSITMIKREQLDYILTVFIFSLITWFTLMLVFLLIENLKQQLFLQRELKRSEKLNVISQLAASVAHEVRNPMTTINGFLQLIKRDENITDTQRNYIDISLGELTRAQDIINDYLSLARPNNSSFQMVNISEELTKTIELMTSYTNLQNIEVVSRIEDNLYINGNTDEVKQVFINILKNGIEAMESNGKLEIQAYAASKKVIIKIADNGEGMTKSQLSRIGTPFYSTKEKGTGIGLTISFQIIEQLKGKINIKSEYGMGTTFIIELPFYEGM
ncbi:GHKL domain-containing protein [Robertmurraya yapensis]|uniref:histidine kinase n=2 Tax=Bacillaceae TaxID=186817 RepID=A0A431W3G4_9BACI|nr:ATP-binding protein [Bacillus yapensis]RTR29964.1 GHKL domain-containing protein [Bacillus yapensis]TKS95045.1 GHKL domain-containing protein [Bacillus yapensis]